MTDQSTAAPNNDSANPAGGDWKAAFGADSAKALETFKAPGDFFKAFQDVSAERDTLKANPGQGFDWRKVAAGGDEKFAKELERLSDLGSFGKSWKEAQTKIRSGELAKPLPANATPEQLAEWRKGNGIPEKPEGYFEKLPNGRVIGKDDQPLFNEVAGRLHKLNAAPGVMHELVEWYYSLADNETAKISEADKAGAKAVEDKLREAWGNDYRSNANHLENYLSGLPQGLQKAFRDGFGGDGVKLMHNAEFQQWLSNIAREFNPMGMVTAGGGENQMQSIDAEIGTIEKLMRENRAAYNKDEKMQARYRDLINAREKLKKRVA